ncbi:hypothetical protein HRbin39_00447 [bacterium HR39]|nr:hypothetical protein HRbin39_00447 [bacterium HR39]
MTPRPRLGITTGAFSLSGARPSPVRLPPPPLPQIPPYALVTETGSFLVTDTGQPLVYGPTP